jgi:hypothetical protein
MILSKMITMAMTTGTFFEFGQGWYVVGDEG